MVATVLMLVSLIVALLGMIGFLGNLFEGSKGMAIFSLEVAFVAGLCFVFFNNFPNGTLVDKLVSFGAVVASLLLFWNIHKKHIVSAHEKPKRG